MVVDIPDVVTYTNFGDYRLRDFWVAGGQISPSPIDFHRRPYNILALPCECVILDGEEVAATGATSLGSTSLHSNSLRARERVMWYAIIDNEESQR